VEHRAHAKAQHCATNKACEDEHVRWRNKIVARADDAVQVERASDSCYGTEEVRPDVDGFVMQIKEGPKRVQVGRTDLTIARVNESVVAAPGGEVAP
jgi:hypothetical protein